MEVYRGSRDMRQKNWCEKCQYEMELTERLRCALPAMIVKRGLSSLSAADYNKYLVKVSAGQPVPGGMFSCSAYVYRCPACGNLRIRLSVFRPTGNDGEPTEEILLFDRGELDGFLHRPG